MLPETVRCDIEQQLGTITGDPSTLHGGDINNVFLVNIANDRVVIKTHATPYPGMYEAEASGLIALSKAAGFRIPKVHYTCDAYIALEYITPGPQQQVKGAALGIALSSLHQTTSEVYGWDHDNYIGSLPQSNAQHKDGIAFYREERLLPQFKRAKNKGFTFRNLDTFLKNLDDLIPQEPASLIHGDLWSGNFMVSDRGEPCLIDPATCYANREMDLAMMALFGGFPKNYTDSYNEAYALYPRWKERIPLWQLYYILVHLNLFGAGYYSRCMQIIKRYS
ncbi:fructosamine kinase family protein [Robertkochia sediminum]|uniref:fructosamine kinase family protein n=1 Tax=Robertkochia sediminum TaxID=2785326 RepID=UPI0019321F89|nr:fructosamine kinase family protein [Robertkochia sediminum]MBL7472416.1 fructosamine kinase family protein [Robertkochia sediminum]